ncbi:MAG: molybdopterin-binding protein [Clostridia bacterium]|jgi:hypothetical protein|nr:molybdopterin-binding protein [Clostridia bacterium]
MNTVRVEDAVGMVLAHDLTKIVPGKFKGPAFKKGHVIRNEDIETLKDIGKNHINILELKDGYIHENEAARRISRALSSNRIAFSEPSEGKIELRAACRGVVKINTAALSQVNEIDEVIVASIHTNTLVEEGQLLAATRVIPLTIDEEKIIQVEIIGESFENEIITVQELRPKKIGVVIIGTEVYEGRIADGFAPVMREKIRHYGCTLLNIQYCPDDLKSIEDTINGMIADGAEVVLACGGMSVDADDITPRAIKNTARYVVSYGVPIIPGNMLMLAYKGNIAIFGIPAAAIFMKNTSLDIILPRVLADDKITCKDLAAYGHGGLCWGCKFCTYPACPYGK